MWPFIFYSGKLNTEIVFIQLPIIMAINTIKYLSITSNTIKKVQGISNREGKNNNNDNDNGEYYNICLNCANKIVEFPSLHHELQ